MIRRSIFFTIGFITITVFTILGLIFNIKTNIIHDQSKELMQMISQLTHENKELEYKITTATRLDNIEKIAREKLNMQQPKRIHYFTSSPRIQDDRSE